MNKSIEVNKKRSIAMKKAWRKRHANNGLTTKEVVKTSHFVQEQPHWVEQNHQNDAEVVVMEPNWKKIALELLKMYE